jgi:hypothetical protein
VGACYFQEKEPSGGGKIPARELLWRLVGSNASQGFVYGTFAGISESSLLLLLLTASVHLECAKFRGKGRSAISYRERGVYPHLLASRAPSSHTAFELLYSKDERAWLSACLQIKSRSVFFIFRLNVIHYFIIFIFFKSTDTFFVITIAH